jgi:hypothetical protein
MISSKPGPPVPLKIESLEPFGLEALRAGCCGQGKKVLRLPGVEPVASVNSMNVEN